MSAEEVSIWIEEPNPRARYAAEQLFERMLGWKVRWADTPGALQAATDPCLAYSREPVHGAFHLKPCGWLVPGADCTANPDVEWRDALPQLFPMPETAMGFDPLAASFFLLARVEEYNSLPCEAHGRVLTSALHADQHRYLHLPVVDEWAILLAKRWRAVDPRVPEPKRAYAHVVTVDLDNGFKYKGRPLWRTLGSWARDLFGRNGQDVLERARVLFRNGPDPFELDREVLDAFEASAKRRIAFILAAERGEWDHAVPVEHPGYTAYLRSLTEHLEIGIHPSYRTSVSAHLTANERDRLRDAVSMPILLSRQHFLRFATPGTFRTAIESGFTEEHSMGCHDRLGFRAGTCTPYAWYDLEHERATALIIHPFAVMDNTLREKLKLDPDAAVEAARAIIDSVKRVRGTFTGLWHESFLSSSASNRAWRLAILRIIREAAP